MHISRPFHPPPVLLYSLSPPCLCMLNIKLTTFECDADGGFYDAQWESILYGPTNLGSVTTPGTPSPTTPTPTSPAVPAGTTPSLTPTTNKIVGFTVKLSKFDINSFNQTDPTTGKTPAQSYIEGLNLYLRANINPLAYSSITSFSAGSVSVQTQAFIPYTLSDSASSATAATDATNLQAALGSSSALATMFPPGTFGTSSVDPASISVRGVTLSLNHYSIITTTLNHVATIVAPALLKLSLEGPCCAQH